MMKPERGVSRRDLIRGGAGVAMARVLGLSTGVGEAADGPRSRVVLVRDLDALDDTGVADPGVVHDMLNRAVAALFDEEKAAAAWRRIVGPGDVVGVKSNHWRRLRTPEALEEAIRAEVTAAGVRDADVSVDDRGVRSNPVFARATALINVRPMRTHDWSGLGTCLKNMIMFTPRPPEYHGDTCASLGAIWKLPQVAGKVRLNILVMLTPQFHGVGPHSFSPDFVWPYRGLVVGVDPVAVDATGARIIQARRDLHFGGPSPIRPDPHHILYADTRYGIGVSDPARIEVVRVGASEGSLI